MKLKYCISLMVFGFLQAQSVGLVGLIDGMEQNDHLIKSYDYQAQAAQKDIEATQRTYFPTIDLGASYQNNDPAKVVSPKEIKTLYGTVTLNIFDGGKRGAVIGSKKYTYKAAEYEKEAFAKSEMLDVVQSYYNIKKLQANLLVIELKSKELEYQIQRANSFLKAGLMTQDDVDKMQAEYDANQYDLENIKLSLDDQQEHLVSKTGLDCNSLTDATFLEPDTSMPMEDYEKTKVFDMKTKSIDEIASSVISALLPNIALQDTYYKYYYGEDVRNNTFLYDTKNVLMLNASWRVFDGGQVFKQKEQYELQMLALQEQKFDSIANQKSSFILAKKRLTALLSQIKSASSALKSSQSTYAIIANKFDAGLVDNVTYLDALNAQSAAMSRYKSALYDYEVAKSLFYYFAGKNPKEYIR